MAGWRKRRSLAVELGIVAEDAVLVERQAAVGGEVLLDAVDFHHRLAAQLEARVVSPMHEVGEHIVEPLHELEQAGVDVRPAVAEHKRAPILLERALEVIEVMRNAGIAEML